MTVRGVLRQAIFLDDRDRRHFLIRLADAVEAYGLRLYLYTLMSNHFHLLVETPQANLSIAMGAFLTAYTTYFNRRHRRSGHVIQGRFHSVLVEGDEYLLKLSRYIHLNPVFTRKARSLALKERVRMLRTYPWSSYRGYIGRGKPEKFVDYGPLRQMAAEGRRDVVSAYRRYVEAGLAETDEDFIEIMRGSRLGIGSDAFRARIEALHDERANREVRREDAVLRRRRERVLPEAIVRELGEELGVRPEEFRKRRRNSWLRGMAARAVCRYGGLTQREAAERLGMGTGVAVSRQLRSLHSALQKDRRLRRRVAAVERRLKALQLKTC